MTTALCLNCGALKFGALCPCPECDAETCGNREYDLFFTDHLFTVDFLEVLSEDFKDFKEFDGDDQTRLTAFLIFAAEYAPEDIRIDFRETQENMHAFEFLQKYRPQRRDVSNIDVTVSHDDFANKLPVGLSLLTPFALIGAFIYITWDMRLRHAWIGKSYPYLIAGACILLIVMIRMILKKRREKLN